MSDDYGELDHERLLHQFKNHLSVVTGFCDLLLIDLPPGSPLHADIGEMRKAAQSALDMLPELARRLA